MFELAQAFLILLALHVPGEAQSMLPENGGDGSIWHAEHGRADQAVGLV